MRRAFHGAGELGVQRLVDDEVARLDHVEAALQFVRMQGVIDWVDNAAGPPDGLRDEDVVDGAGGGDGHRLAGAGAALAQGVRGASDLAVEGAVAGRLSGESFLVDDLIWSSVGDVVLHQLGDGDSRDVDPCCGAMDGHGWALWKVKNCSVQGLYVGLQ
jgi:hypothetical protein